MQDPTNRLTATYLLESPNDLERAIDVLAGEGSTGTFVAVPGEDEILRERFAIRLEELQELEPTDRPRLAGRDWDGLPGMYRRARIKVSVPLDLTATDLTTLLACVAGNVFELREVSALRLLDFDLPPEFLSAAPRPRYSINGTRALLDATDRPLRGAVMPAGLAPTAALKHLRSLLADGADLVTDGEIAPNPHHWPFSDRVEAITRVLTDHARPGTARRRFDDRGARSHGRSDGELPEPRPVTRAVTPVCRRRTGASTFLRSIARQCPPKGGGRRV